jgi:hypothetical protein
MLIENLLGQTIYTLGRDRPNVVKGVEGDNVIVGTRRSPGGKPVPLSLVQMGLDKLHQAGDLRVSPETFNGRRRSSFIGAAIATLPGVAVEHRPVIQLLLAERHPEAAADPVTSASDGYPDPVTARSVDDTGVKVAIGRSATGIRMGASSRCRTTTPDSTSRFFVRPAMSSTSKSRAR